MSGNDRNKLLSRLVSGDIVFAITQSGLEKLLLVEQTVGGKIICRHVTTQITVMFDAVNGEYTNGNGEVTSRIISVSPLPPQQYNAVVGLDRKMRLAHYEHEFRLSDEKKRILIDLGAYYAKNPLPEDS